jgi:hypothetical protein
LRLPFDAQTTWHVRADGGSNQENGLTESTAFASIQHAIDLTQPGDTVLIHAGVYFEKLILKRAGTADAPITIKADRIAKDQVIITGANQAIRQHKQTWKCVDPTLMLYRVPMAYRPTRVLADQVDLLAYPDLPDLKAFWFLKSDYPGHEHGFAWEPTEKMLYVRLRADCKYNTSTNPNDLTMAVSPPPGIGKYGLETQRDDYQNLHIALTGSAHIIIDGITFETPGIAGIYTQANDVLVRNCWFYGCRTGVAGPRVKSPKNRAHRITVEHCFFTQFPTYTDEEQTILKHAQTQHAKTQSYQHLMHWQRKGNYPPGDGVGRPWGYEVGLILCMGDDWLIQNNMITDAFEGISASGTNNCRNTMVINNCFQRICDNAVESENHGMNLTIAGNLVIDTFEPFSWQPLDGDPLPGPVYIHDNIIMQTPRDLALWTTAGNWPGILKIGAKTHYWQAMHTSPQTLTIPGGFWFVHNTVVRQRGRFLTWLNDKDWPIDGVHVINNLIATWRLGTSSTLYCVPNITFDHNIVWPTMPIDDNGTVDQNLEMAAGPHGRWLPAAHGQTTWQDTLAGITDLPVGMTTQTTNSPEIPTCLKLRSDIGAMQINARFGPQVTIAGATR